MDGWDGTGWDGMDGWSVIECFIYLVVSAVSW